MKHVIHVAYHVRLAVGHGSGAQEPEQAWVADGLQCLAFLTKDLDTFWIIINCHSFQHFDCHDLIAPMTMPDFAKRPYRVQAGVYGANK